jgi:hypothetical protein
MTKTESPDVSFLRRLRDYVVCEKGTNLVLRAESALQDYITAQRAWRQDVKKNRPSKVIRDAVSTCNVAAKEFWTCTFAAWWEQRRIDLIEGTIEPNKRDKRRLSKEDLRRRELLLRFKAEHASRDSEDENNDNSGEGWRH